MPEGAERGEDKPKGAQTQPLFMVGQGHHQFSRFVTPAQEIMPKNLVGVAHRDWVMDPGSIKMLRA